VFEVHEVVFAEVMVGRCLAEVAALKVPVRLASLSRPLRLHRSHYQSLPPRIHQFLECRVTRQKMFGVFHMVLV
jgi:hypothetical protein